MPYDHMASYTSLPIVFELKREKSPPLPNLNRDCQDGNPLNSVLNFKRFKCLNSTVAVAGTLV